MSEEEIEVVTLKSGHPEGKALTLATYHTLSLLFDDKAIVFYELFQLAKDPAHQIWGNNTVEELKSLALLQSDGSMHDSIRQIILSAVSGEGFNMVLDNPIAETVEAK